MEFTLFYEGNLKANASPKEKHKIREVFHPQLKMLWEQLPLKEHRDLLQEKAVGKVGSKVSLIHEIKGFQFAPLVSERINLVAELDVTLLRPEEPGSIITKSGDIDNRLKTLLDALRLPKEPQDLPGDITERPIFFCLLEDDNLITKLSIRTDRLLHMTNHNSEAVLLIHVQTKATRATWENDGLG